MPNRYTTAGIALLALASTLSAQSTVRPLPRAAFPTELAWSLATVPATPSAPGFVLRDDLFPPTTLYRANDPQREDGTGHEDQGPDVNLDLRLLMQPQSDFSDGPGSMAVQRGGWDAYLGWRTGESTGLTLNIHSEASFYDFTNATGLVPGSGNGEPLNDVYETSLGTTMCTKYTDRVSWFTSGALTLSGEDRASLSDAVTVGLVGGLRYQANESLALETGLAVQTLLEDGSWVLPYLGFDWQIDEKLRLMTEGSRVRLSADLDPAWTLYGMAAYEIRQYRLNDSNPLSSGVMRDEEIDLGLGLDWHPKAGLTVGVQAGVVPWRELTFFNKGGSRVSETESSPSPFAGFTLSFSF